MKHEEEAKRIDELLKSGAGCNDPALVPLQQMAEALKREASGSVPGLDRQVASKQRATLISMAQANKAQSAGSAPIQTDMAGASVRPSFSERLRSSFSGLHAKPFMAWSGGFIAVAAVLVAAVFLYRGQLFGDKVLPDLSGLNGAAISRLLIPEAHAADAFSVIAETKGKDGVDTTTAFMVSSTIQVTADELKQHLQIVPADPTDIDALKPSAVSVAALGNGQFKVQPQEALSPGKVYKVVIQAAVEKADGSRDERDFSWAVQTRNVFRVVSSIPADSSAGVPINTGIEFEMSQVDWEDPASFFSIQPAVSGRFEAHGRSLVFVPEKPLAYSQLYTVTLKKGLKLQGSENALPEDLVIKFETQSLEQSKDQGNQYKPIVYPSQDYNQFVVNKDASLPVNWYGQPAPQVEVVGYSLTQDEAVAYLMEHDKTPDFAVLTRERNENYDKYTKKQAFTLTAAPESASYYGYKLRLPNNLPVGNYLVRLKTQGVEKFAWTFIDVTRSLTYTIADDKALVVWAMNVETERPLGDLPVSYDQTSMRTDRDGVARLPVPEILTATDTTKGTGVALKIGSGDLSSVIWLRNEGRYWGYYWRNSSNDQTISHIYHDRPLYKTTDKLFAYGMVRDRASDKPATDATLELAKAGYYWDYFTHQEKIYRRAEIKTDDQGFFRAEMDWSKLAPGYYQLRIVRNGETVTSHNFEIRDYVKPAYSIDVSFDKQQVFAGEGLVGEARVEFFDGTPVAEMELSLNISGSQNGAQQIKTDANGIARFTVKTENWTCDPNQQWFNCPSSRSLNVDISPTDGEEGEISGSAYATVWHARVSLDSYARVTGDQAKIQFTARKVDLRQGQAIDSATVLVDPLRDANINGRIIEETWVQIQTGTRYDYGTKQTYPTYKYETNRRDVATVNVTTDAAGKASMDFAIPSSTASYRIIASVKDENGVQDYTVAYFSSNHYRNYDYGTYPGTPDVEDKNYYFQPPKEQNERPGYDVGEKVSVSFYQGENKLKPTENPVFLYVKSHLGMKDVAVTNQPTYEFDFSQDLIPNVAVRGILFRDGGFYVRDYSAGIDQDLRQMTINISADKDSYAPGSQAKLHVSLKTKAGLPASNARLVMGVVDESVYAAANGQTGGIDPLSSLYSWVSDGILVESASHMANADEALMKGGAEMGGGGGEQVRRNFKDTAAFQTVTADANGQADITIDLPDNITSWRATVVGITPNLYAGQSIYNIKVTKQIFVDAVAPTPLLAKDQPVLKLRAYGLALKSGEEVTFQVDAPRLGLQNETVKGKAFEPVYVAINKLVPGEHSLILKIKTASGNDAMEKKIVVLDTRFFKQEKAEVELGPGVGLPSVGNTREIELTFLPKSRAQYLNQVWSLSYSWRQRLDSLVAERLARTLLKDQFNQEKVTIPAESLQKFQKPSGGLSLLSYSSEDPELTAKVAAIAPDMFDRVSMQAYFASILQQKDVSREEQLRALSGLAALGAPVLQQLQDMSAINDLTWREQLAVMRGLNSMGDQDGARKMLDALLAKSEINDGLRFVRISDAKRDNLEATSEAAVVAADLLHPSAPELSAWLMQNWAEDAYTSLDKIAYLNKVVPMSYSRDVMIGYTLGTEEKTVTLKGGWWGERLQLTADEAARFRITKADGPAVAVFMREMPGLPQQNPDISVERSYENADRQSVQELHENQPVYVKLTVKWQANAQSGCYTLRDHLPAALSPAVNIFNVYNWHEDIWYPSDMGDGAVSFVVCNPQSKDSSKNQTEIRYKARVVSRGTYLAEPAVLQSNDAPSISALSGSQTIIIK
ncbi:MAG: alpha-2-macroglobulin family protein [Patescibacteria group bacterium]|nr:alpha-2-macroglobulin family protein [Patescibacteria group bacterium]